MALPSSAPSLFTDRCLVRGQGLHRSGAVSVIEKGPSGIRCLVRDQPRELAVYIALDSSRIATWCGCRSRSRCEHIWAAFLAADAAGLLSQPVRMTRPVSARHWRERLAALRRYSETRAESWPVGRQIVYVVDHAVTLEGDGVALQIALRDQKRSGDWTRPKPLRMPIDGLIELPDPADRQILGLLVGARDGVHSGYSRHDPRRELASSYRLDEDQQTVVIPLLCATGRAFLRLKDEGGRPGGERDMKPLAWDGGEPWRFWLEAKASEDDRQYWVTGSLRRGDERRSLLEPSLLTAGGLMFLGQSVARFDHGDAFAWVAMLRREDAFAVGRDDGPAFVAELLSHCRLPPIDFPDALHVEEVRMVPRPLLTIGSPSERRSMRSETTRLIADLAFDYDGFAVRAGDRSRGIYQPETRRFLRRDPAFEAASSERLRRLGFRPSGLDPTARTYDLAPRNLPGAVRALVGDGWKVEAQGKLFRPAGALRFKVTSGIDWFDLSGGAAFDQVEVPLPALLRALSRGEKTVRLGDGTYGILPEEWLRRYQILVETGEEAGDSLRFRRHQVGLLDALLASQAEVEIDQIFTEARQRLARFESPTPMDAPDSFVGALRPYQRQGLGWLHFLREFGFGGCLADDMGLGKTVQVLALLEARRRERGDRNQPSLVVAPRSLIFNWKQEAERFTPQLRILDHSGADRPREAGALLGHDVVLTTYGTLRRDIAFLQGTVFDYAVLDESQAIKNAGTESAKAARLLRADHRLALSGTPIENHISELWSLFEFLNPGLLGRARSFEANSDPSDPESRALLARVIKPFFLRRTKEQVIDDLPPKLEQTIYCDLEGEQQRLYGELREHYRASLRKRIERDGIAKSKIQILEALLRLRQAACHPGLIDHSRSKSMSAKLEALLPMIEEVRAEGHKALIFSQFVSLLTIVRARIEGMGLPYEYLDGRTRDRAKRVRHFQEDPDCGLFLVSLKAGGLGLNLTAADYVFLLDPWWNPAVEAQAIDRTHRIGQTRPVFAYRLIARDTVEEKVLALQASKRRLADAILGEDASLIRGICREDLELLLR